MKASTLSLSLFGGLSTVHAFVTQPQCTSPRPIVMPTGIPFSSASSTRLRVLPVPEDAAAAAQTGDTVVERRMFMRKFVLAVGLGSVSALPAASQAADSASGPTIWNSGKTPKVPGQKPKDKNDTSGTRRDGNFLRSIADCKNQCENTTGSDGFTRSKEECLSDCQDVCCKTYEQCTFAIVPRI